MGQNISHQLADMIWLFSLLWDRAFWENFVLWNKARWLEREWRRNRTGIGPVSVGSSVHDADAFPALGGDGETSGTRFFPQIFILSSKFSDYVMERSAEGSPSRRKDNSDEDMDDISRIRVAGDDASSMASTRALFEKHLLRGRSRGRSYQDVLIETIGSNLPDYFTERAGRSITWLRASASLARARCIPFLVQKQYSWHFQEESRRSIQSGLGPVRSRRKRGMG